MADADARVGDVYGHTPGVQEVEGRRSSDEGGSAMGKAMAMAMAMATRRRLADGCDYQLGHGMDGRYQL